jgi:hypothetical protein
MISRDGPSTMINAMVVAALLLARYCGKSRTFHVKQPFQPRASPVRR